MKSVIQEGSSLAKAIEQGWIKAGKPREFTIKIFQDSQKNFFGMTTVPAKVGIFFKEAAQENKALTRHENKPNEASRDNRPRQQQRSPQQQQQYRQRRKYYNDNRQPQQHPQSQQHTQAQQTQPKDQAQHNRPEQKDGQRNQRPQYNQPLPNKTDKTNK